MEIKKKREPFPFNEFCFSCANYGTKCCINKKRDGLLRWKNLGCTYFKED